MKKEKLDEVILATILNCFLTTKAAYRKDELRRILSEDAIISGYVILVKNGVLKVNKSGSISVNKNVMKSYKTLMNRLRLASLDERDTTQLLKDRLDFPMDVIKEEIIEWN